MRQRDRTPKAAQKRQQAKAKRRADRKASGTNWRARGLTVAAVAALALTGCTTREQRLNHACDGHGGPKQIADGGGWGRDLVLCSDGFIRRVR